MTRRMIFPDLVLGMSGTIQTFFGRAILPITFVPNDLSYYRHGSVRADIAAAKAAGYCASS